MASASFLTEFLKEKSDRFFLPALLYLKRLLNKEENQQELSSEKNYTDFKIFQAISDLPGRHKCALLPWETMGRALKINIENSSSPFIAKGEL